VRQASNALLQTVASGAKTVLNHRVFVVVFVVVLAALAGVLAMIPGDANHHSGTWTSGALTGRRCCSRSGTRCWAWRLLIVAVALTNEFFGIHQRLGWPQAWCSSS
jgi:hypothetical protein